MKKWLLAFILLFAAKGQAQTKVILPCAQGGKALALPSVMQSPGVNVPTNLVGSYPLATATLYITGSSPYTLATLYAPGPVGNPFSCDSNGLAQFYVVAGTYDMTFSGTGITTPFTIGGITIGGGGGGGGYGLAFNVKSYGSICDGTVRSPDDTAGFLAAASAAGTNGIVLVPAGANCVVNGHPNFTQDGLTLYRTGAIITSSNTDYIVEFSGSGQQSVGGTFVNNAAAAVNSGAILLGPANHFTDEDGTITCTNSSSYCMGLMMTNLGSVTYPLIADSLFSHDVTITKGRCIAANENPNNPCILLNYVKGAKASGNYSQNYGQGIMWWGGDANANGAITNTRQAQNIVISDNTVFGGAVWGSMGEGVAVTGNSVEQGPDVCLDVEGSFSITVTGNYAADCVNGQLTTLYQNRNVIFSSNTAEVHTFSYPLARVLGLELGPPTQNKDVSFVANVLTNLDPTGIALIETSSASVEKLVFDENTVRDAAVYFTYDLLGVEVSRNSFIYDQANGSNAYAAIWISRTNQCGVCQTIPPMQAVIKDNVIKSNAAQVAGSSGILVQFGSYAHDGYGTADIEGNTLGGTYPFATDISLITDYAGTSKPIQFVVTNNNLAAPLITKSILGYPPQTTLIQTNNVDTTTGENYAGDTTPLGPDVTIVNPNAPLGPESLADPNFASCPGASCGWDSITGGWDATFAGNKLNWNSTGGAGAVNQAVGSMAIPAIPNAWYYFTYTVASTGTPALIIHGEFSIPNPGVYIPVAAGTYTIPVQANSAPTYFELYASGTGTLSIEPVSLKLMGGNIKAQGEITALEGFDSPGDIDATMYASVSAAITALPAAGGVIHADSPLVNRNLGTLDPGTKAVTILFGPYAYTAVQIVARSDFHHYGAGFSTTITSVGSNATPLIVFPQSNGAVVQNFVMQDIQFIGASGNTSQEGMFIDVSGLTGGADFVFSRLTSLLFRNFKGRGIHLKGRPSDVISTIQQSHVEGVTVEMPSGRVGEALRMEGEMGQLSFETCNFSVPSGADAYDDIYAGPSGSSATDSPHGTVMHNITMGGGAVGLHLGGVQNFTMDVGWFESIPTDASITQDSASLGAVSNVGVTITHSHIIGGAATAVVSDTDHYSAVSFNTNGFFYVTPGAFITGANAANVEYCNNKGWAGALGCYLKSQVSSSGFQLGSAVAVGSLPGCASGTLGTRRLVNDANSATPGTTAAGSGTYTVAVECIYNSSGTVYTWIID